MSIAQQIAIYGATGLGQEIAWLVCSCDVDREPPQVTAFVDDDESLNGASLGGIRVIALASVRNQARLADFVCGVESPRERQRLMEKTAAAGYYAVGSFVHPSVVRLSGIAIGVGSLVFPGCVLSTNVRLGRHVLVGANCTIGHAAVVGDYSILGAGVHVAARVHLGQRVSVGIGAVIANDTRDAILTIGDDVVIPAGACVTDSIPAGGQIAPSEHSRQRLPRATRPAESTG